MRGREYRAVPVRLWDGQVSRQYAVACTYSWIPERDGCSLLWWNHEICDADRFVHREDFPQRTDLKETIVYKTIRHELFGQQEGNCNGCRHNFPFHNMEVDHKVPKSKGGPDHISNFQLLCSGCNRLKGDRDMSYLLAELQRQGRNAA